AERVVDAVRDALYAAKISSYAQGMALLRAASNEYAFDLNLSEIARIWKGGCIIRARLLNEIQQAFKRTPDLSNLMIDAEFREALASRQEAWRTAVQTATAAGIPYPATGA